MLVACIGLMKDELDSLKRKESTACNMEVVSLKAADTKGKMNSLADHLRRDTFDSYASIRRTVGKSLVAVS